MFRVVAVLSLLSVLLTALALISCLSVEDGSEIRGLPRFMWVLVILLLPLVGAIAWFVAGRPQPTGRSGSRWPIGGGFPEPPRPKAPDDDPDFLRTLDDQPTITPDDEELLRRWEEDLRRREDELRRPDTDTDG
jgi:hypothetical protein